MTNLQTLDRVVLKEMRAADDDPESQKCIVTPPRGHDASDREQPRWFVELYSRHVSKLQQAARFQSMFTILTRSITPNPDLLPTPTAQIGLPATARSIGLPRWRPDDSNPPSRSVDEYFDQTSEAVPPSRPSSVSDSSHSNVFVAHDVRPHLHKEPIRALAKIPEPFLPLSNSPRDTCILICWGKCSKCHIRGVLLDDAENEVGVWHNVRQAWFASRGPWKKLLHPLLKVKDIDIVTVRINT